MPITVEQIEAETRLAQASWNLIKPVFMGWELTSSDEAWREWARERAVGMKDAAQRGHFSTVMFRGWPTVRFIEVALVGSDVAGGPGRFDSRLSSYRSGHALARHASNHAAVCARKYAALADDGRFGELAEKVRADSEEMGTMLDGLWGLLTAENRVAIRYLLDHPDAAALYPGDDRPWQSPTEPTDPPVGWPEFPNEFAARLRRIAETDGRAEGRGDAAAAACDLLRSLGYGEGADLLARML